MDLLKPRNSEWKRQRSEIILTFLTGKIENGIRTQGYREILNMSDVELI